MGKMADKLYPTDLVDEKPCTTRMTDKKVLIRDIIKVVRERAKEIPKFAKGNGAIRILIHPYCEEADDWAGGLSEFRTKKPDVVDYEFTFHIKPGGSHIITGVWDGVKQRVNCYAYSALKIADCAFAAVKRKGALSGLKLGFRHHTEDNGFGPYPGALCVTIWEPNYDRMTAHEPDLKKFCRIYVCVSGADSKDDLYCAWPAIIKIISFFRNEDNRFEIEVPNGPGKKGTNFAWPALIKTISYYRNEDNRSEI